MLKHSVIAVLSGSLLLSGCTTTRLASLNDYQQDPHGRIERVVLADGSSVEFEMYQKEPAAIENGEIIGYPKYALQQRHIPLSEVQAIYYCQRDVGKSVGAAIGIAAGAYVVVYVLFGPWWDYKFGGFR